MQRCVVCGTPPRSACAPCREVLLFKAVQRLMNLTEVDGECFHVVREAVLAGGCIDLCKSCECNRPLVPKASRGGV